MARLLFGLFLVAGIFWIYTIVDCALFDKERVRGLSKPAWIAVTVLVPVVGGILWFLIGRGRRGRGKPQFRAVAPDDNPEFLHGLERDAAQEERIRRLEQELADLDNPDQPDGSGRPDGPGRSGGPGSGGTPRG